MRVVEAEEEGASDKIAPRAPGREAGPIKVNGPTTSVVEVAPPPDPQSLPVPLTRPVESTRKHCVEPEIPEMVSPVVVAWPLIVVEASVTTPPAWLKAPKIFAAPLNVVVPTAKLPKTMVEELKVEVALNVVPPVQM